MSGEATADVYRLVFELTARATDVPYETFLEELVEGLAAHYHAGIVRLHIGSAAAATADPGKLLDRLDAEGRSRFEAIDSTLAEEVRRDGVLRTALDLEGGDELAQFLARSFRTPESFAFPLMARGAAFGSIALYMGDGYPFEEADVRGLQAIGNVLYAATNQGEVFDEADPVLAESEQLRSYQESLDAVNKILDELLFLTDARNVLLLNNEGDFISKRGDESMFSTTNFATVVASGFAASRRISAFYGAPDKRLVLHEGENENVFVIEVAEKALLCVVYRDHEAPELITRWAKSAANRLVTHYDALMAARMIA